MIILESLQYSSLGSGWIETLQHSIYLPEISTSPFFHMPRQILKTCAIAILASSSEALACVLPGLTSNFSVLGLHEPHKASFSVKPRDWKIPDTSAVLSIIYYVSVILISFSVIACSIVGYVDYLRCKDKPPPRWFTWIAAKTGGRWMTRYWSGKTASELGTPEQNEENRQHGDWSPGMGLRAAGGPGNTGWLNIDNDVIGPEGSNTAAHRGRDGVNRPAQARTRGGPGWVDVIQQAEAHRQRHCPLPPLGMAVGLPTLEEY